MTDHERRVAEALEDVNREHGANLRRLADVRSPEGPAPSDGSCMTDAILMAVTVWRARNDEDPPSVVYDIARAAYRIGLRGRAAVGKEAKE